MIPAPRQKVVEPRGATAVAGWERLLACPACRNELTRTSSGFACKDHGLFPLRDGIACFASEHDAVFRDHWQAHQLPEIAAPKLDEADRFLRPLFEHLDRKRESAPLQVLDAGCGDGVHIASLCRRYGVRQRLLGTGIDISLEALRQARRRGAGAWRFVQGDLGRLPFHNGVFDVVYCYGVLAYTRDPRASLVELCRVLKPGGMIGTWVAPRPAGVSGAMFRGVRRMCRLGGRFVTRRMADVIVPLLPWLPTRSGVSLQNASWKECREVVLVNIAPPTLTLPAADEIRCWHAESGIRMEGDDAGAPITLWGAKS